LFINTKQAQGFFMQHLNQGNNEVLSVGINAESDGTFTALTLTASKNFKTERGAEKWLAKRGYDKNGNSIQF
jgi:hypothetical protein